MDLTPYVDGIKQDLMAAAEVAGPDAAPVADRLLAALDAAIRLAFLDALSAAADEVTSELAPGAVEVRLRQGQPSFVVTPPPADAPVEPPTVLHDDPAGATSARITLRLPEALKTRVDAAATVDGLSVNTWIVRALTSSVRDAQPHRPGKIGQSFQGWVR